MKTYVFVFIIFFSGLLSLVLVHKRYLMSLLSLEFMLLSVYFIMYFFFQFVFFHDFHFIICFLVMGVFEGVLSLSLIVCLFSSKV